MELLNRVGGQSLSNTVTYLLDNIGKWYRNYEETQGEGTVASTKRKTNLTRRKRAGV